MTALTPTQPKPLPKVTRQKQDIFSFLITATDFYKI